MLEHEIVGPVIAGGLAALGAFIAVRVSVARIDSTVKAHMKESDRRFDRVERVVGITGDPPVFLTAAEWRARMEAIVQQLDDLKADLKEVLEKTNNLEKTNGREVP